MKNYVQEGRTITVVAPYDVTSGGGVKVGGLFGVANTTAVEDDPVEIDRIGVFDIAKVAATAVTAGAKVYWDDTNKVITPTASGNLLVGAALDAALAAATTVRVVLDGAVR